MTPFEQVTVEQGWINLVIQFFIALGAFVVAALALWGDRIKDWWFGPKLGVSVQLEPPYCQRIEGGTWFRLRVDNASDNAAQNVELWLAEIHRHVQNVWLRHDLVPIPLIWTHTESEVASSINPSFHRYIDLGYLAWGQQSGESAPANMFSLVTKTAPADRSHMLRPGSYRVLLAVTASNMNGRYFTFRFEVPEPQMPTEDEALKGVNLRAVAS